MTYRLLHLADLHLDRAFAGMGCHGEIARRRRHGLRDALRRIGETAVERGCDAVTIAGDLYEHERADAGTAAFLVDLFAGWRPLRVLIAPGNHDPLLPGSLYERTDWPGNVHLFSEPELRPVELAEGLTLWGLAHREPSWQGDPLEGRAISGGGLHLALFHGAEMGSRPPGKAVHGPFRAERIRMRGLTAALCGHYHRRRIDHRTGLFYPGSPEPLSFDETEARGPLLVTIGNSGGVEAEPLDLNAWFARTVECPTEAAGSLHRAIELASDAVRDRCTGLPPHRTMVRVDLVGEIASATALDMRTVEAALRETTGVAVVQARDRTEAVTDLEGITAERTSRGAFARSAIAARASSEDPTERAVLNDALRYGLQALSGAEVGLR